MSLFKKLMLEDDDDKNRPVPFESSPQKSGSVFRDLMASAQPTRNIYPTIDTRGKAPINDEPQGILDFILDNASAGIGNDIKSVGEISERLSRHGRDADEWHNDEQNAWRRSLQEAGQEMYDRNIHYYEPGTAEYYLSQAIQSAPSSLAMMGAGAAAGTLIAPVIGTAGGAIAGALRSAPAIGRTLSLLGQAGKAYLKGNTMGARAARTLIPDVRSGTAAVTSAAIESALEEQNSIDNQMANGVSREEAERRANELFWDDLAIVTGFNGFQYGRLFGKTPKMFGVTKPVQRSLPNKVARFEAAATSEGLEEMFQTFAQQHEEGRPVDWGEISDAGIVGAIMGNAFQGAGAVGNRVINGRQPSYDEQKEIWDAAVAANNQLEADKYGRKKYETLHGEETARQALSDAQTERDARLRGWATDITGNQMSDEVYNLIVQSAQKHGVPVEHALAQAFAESQGNPDAISPVGAIGVMQLMPETAERLRVNPNDLAQNIDGGVRHLKEQYDTFGDWNLAHAAYNAGSQAVINAGGIPNYAETQDYVAKINGYLSESGNFQEENSRTRALFGVENYNMPTQSNSIDNQVSRLKDGWQTIIPQIGGVLREKFGINAEISSAARTAEHNAEVGGVPTSHHIIRENGGDALDIVFDRETSQEEQNAIADYFKSTGLFSEVLYHDVGSGAHLHLGGLKTENLGVKRRADQLYNQRIKKGWQREIKEGWQREKSEAEEPAKPLFDMNAQDSTTQKLLEQFASEQLVNADRSKNAETVNFFAGMFDEAGNFQNTQENRDALNNRFGERLTSWAENILSAEQKNPGTSEPKQAPKSETPSTKVDNPFQRNAAIRNAGKNFLEQLRTEGDKNKGEVAFRLQSALNKNNAAEIENILKQNNVPISEPSQTQTQTQQQDPVTQNQPPENILVQPQGQTKAKVSATDKQIKIASAPVKTGSKGAKSRKKQGQALINLAGQNRIEIPNPEVIALANGSTKAVQKWRDTLMAKGLFQSVANGQTQTNSPEATSSNEATTDKTIETQLDSGVTAFTPPNVIKERNSLKHRVKQILAKTAAEHTRDVLRERAVDESNDELDEEPAFDYSDFTNEETLSQGERQRLENENIIRRYQAQQETERQKRSAQIADIKTAQAEEQARQAQEQARLKSAEQSRRAVEQGQKSFGEAQSQSVQQQRQQEQAQNNSQPPLPPQTATPVFNPVLQDEQGKRFRLVPKEGQGFVREYLDEEEPPATPPPKIIEPPQETPPEQNADVYGRTAQASSKSRALYPVRYKVVEAKTLSTSHKIDGLGVVKNDDYKGYQPRDRERADQTQQIIEMANRFDPIFALDTALSVNDGSAVVTNDGTVWNGNRRTMALQYAYENNDKGKLYKNALIERAGDFGLNADEISKMNQPVLVRELAKDLTDAEKTDIADTTAGGSGMSASEQAKSDAKKLTANVFANVPQDTVIDFRAEKLSAAAKELLTKVLRAAENSDDISRYTQSDGSIAQDGATRAERAILAYTYPRDTIIARMTEATDPVIKTVNNALLNAAPNLFRARAGIEHGNLHKYDLDAIADAVDKFADLKAQGKKVSDYMKEGELEGTGLSAEAKEILSVFDNNNRSANKITEFLNGIAQGIVEQGDPNQGSLFGSSEPESFMSLIKKARQVVEGDKSPKFSKSGEVDTRIEKFVDDEGLTPQQKLLKSFGEKLGTRVRFFDSKETAFHGVRQEGTTFLNVNSEKPLEKVFWHETLHWLSNNNPKIFKELMKTTGITDEEILADQMEDIAKRTGLLQNVAGKNRSLIERVVQWLKDTMNKFIEHFRNPDGKLTTKQSIALADEFGKIAKDLTDGDGKKIFRYNRQTHNIELVDGRTFETNHANAKPKYSIGNYNSSESLKQIIKSKMSNWFGKPNSRREKTITENLRKLSGHRILYGNVKGADDVVVDHLQKLIQSRHTYDWEKLLPVVGKEIAKNLKLNPTAEQSNYIADWLLTGALNNASAEAKAFAKAMRDNPAMAELLMETRGIFQEIANMSAEQRIRNSIKPLQGESFLGNSDFTEQVLDDLSPLQKVVDEAVKNGTPAIAEMIKRSVNPKQLAQLSRGSGDIADLMVNGTAKELEKIRASLSEKYPGVYFDKFKPMAAIIQSVGGDWEGLQTFAVAKLSKEMYEYNRAHPELAEPLIPYTSEADADTAIKNGEKKFGTAQQDLVRYSKILLAMEHDAGLIADKTFYNLMKAWKNYAPMAQVFDENEDYVKLDYLKRRKGHLGNTWSPIEIMMANTHKRIQACERNKVKLEIATLVRFGDFDSNLSEVASSNPDADNIIRFRENGKVKYLETPDPAIKRAVDALQTQSDGDWLTKILRAITGFMRARYTGGNLDFAAGNIFRDMPDSYIHNNQLGKDVWIIGDLLKAWRSSFTELFNAARGKGMSQDYIDWKMNGGGQAAFVSQDVDYIQRSIDNATTTRLQRYRQKPFSQLLDDMQKISEFTENVTRLTTYKLAKAKLDKNGADSLTSKQLSALAAREATIDFAKAGHSVRKLNKHFFFANAAVQSFNQWIEAGKEFRKGNTKPLFGKLFRAAAHGVLMAGLQAAVAYGGDDDRKKAYLQAQNWEKETYWILGDYKIPKGFDPVMRLWANLTDEFAGAVFADKPLEAERFWETFKGALPSLTATIATPAIEAYSNYSFFRKAPIVPLREQHLDAEAQFDANTSWLAKAVGQMFGWSPRKIDHLISGYLGSMVSSILKPNTTDPDKFPMIRRFVFEPYKNPKIVQEYYEAYEAQTEHYNTYKLTKEKPDDYDPALYKRLKAVNETMRNISNRERAIMNDPKLSYDERRAKLLELEKKRVAICEKVFKRAW